MDKSTIIKNKFKELIKSKDVTPIDKVVISKAIQVIYFVKPNTTNNVFKVISALNLMNACAKIDLWKTDNLYQWLKDIVRNIIEICICSDFTDINIFFKVDTAYIEIYDIQFSFQMIPHSSIIDKYKKSERNIIKDWSGIRLQSIATDVFKIANEDTKFCEFPLLNGLSVICKITNIEDKSVFVSFYDKVGVYNVSDANSLSIGQYVHLDVLNQSNRIYKLEASRPTLSDEYFSKIIHNNIVYTEAFVSRINNNHVFIKPLGSSSEIEIPLNEFPFHYRIIGLKLNDKVCIKHLLDEEISGENDTFNFKIVLNNSDREKLVHISNKESIQATSICCKDNVLYILYKGIYSEISSYKYNSDNNFSIKELSVKHVSDQGVILGESLSCRKDDFDAIKIGSYYNCTIVDMDVLRKLVLVKISDFLGILSVNDAKHYKMGDTIPAKVEEKNNSTMTCFLSSCFENLSQVSDIVLSDYDIDSIYDNISTQHSSNIYNYIKEHYNITQNISLNTSWNEKLEGTIISIKNNVIVLQKHNKSYIGIRDSDILSLNEDIFVSDSGTISEKNISMGYITAFAHNNTLCYGFIKRTNNSNFLYFDKSSFLDKEILEFLSDCTTDSSTHPQVLENPIPVVFLIGQNSKGLIAKSIHKSDTIRNLLDKADVKFSNKDYRYAQELIDLVLEVDPRNQRALNLKEDVPHKNINSDSPLYDKAKALNLDGDFDSSIEYYKKAIAANQKTRSAIKDLGMLYSAYIKTLHGNEKENLYKEAVNFMKEYSHNLGEESDNLYFLENFYYSIGDYESFYPLAEKIISTSKYNKQKKQQYLYKLAVAYYRQEKFEQATKYCDASIEIDRDDIRSLHLKENINIAIMNGSANDNELIDDNNEFPNRTFRDAKLEEDSVILDDQSLKDIGSKEQKINYIDELLSQDQKYSYKADLLFAKAKLIGLEHEKAQKTFSEFCYYSALSSLYNDADIETTRFYLREAITHCEDNERKHYQSLYFLTLLHNTPAEINEGITNKHKWADLLIKLTQLSFNKTIWENLFLTPKVSIKYLFDNAREEAISAINRLSKEKCDPQNYDSFKKAFNNLRWELQNKDFNAIRATETILSEKNISNFCHRLDSLKDIESQFDKEKLLFITEKLKPQIHRYIKANSYQTKMKEYDVVCSSINMIKSLIKKKPSYYSYEALLPLIDYSNTLLQEAHNSFVINSQPEVELELLNKEILVKNDYITLQIQISNKLVESAPISNISISTNGVSDSIIDQIGGGEYHIFQLTVPYDKESSFLVTCNYLVNNEQNSLINVIEFNVYEEKDFGSIYNPYSFGEVVQDQEMFFGRTDFISELTSGLLNSPNKQYIIYGQKRSGKSSVLFFLEQELKKHNVFCASCTLSGDSITDAEFYFELLSYINMALGTDTNCEVVPNFDIPANSDDFERENMSNPSFTFIKYMIQLNKAFRETPGWEQKRIVLLIDEFSYIYTNIKNGKMSDSIMKQWKGIMQNTKFNMGVVLVGQDIIPTWKNEPYAINAFQVIEDKRLTYLKEEDARNLLEKPLEKKNGYNIYKGNAVSRILYYTSFSPYYIQMFASRMVQYMNKKRIKYITESEVDIIANSFLTGTEKLEESDFDCLIRGGEKTEYQEFSDDTVISVLKRIAELQEQSIEISTDHINNIIGDKHTAEIILKRLRERDVLNEHNYIIIKLFQKWLIK